MKYIKTAWRLFDNYLLARWQNRPSTALFWYLPEGSTIRSSADLSQYKASAPSPRYLIDYTHKLTYALENQEGIIVLPYDKPIGKQVNPEAAFQYALALHDQYRVSQNQSYRDKFWLYVNYFLAQQSKEGLWAYLFDWYGSKAPWYSALAQARGASVMLRAWLLSREAKYRESAFHALKRFSLATNAGGFSHIFEPSQSPYYEEYPQTPTGVLNGFMASLISIWEVGYWTQEPWLNQLWTLGLRSLEAMLPYYSTGWWSLYDLDEKSPIANVNSPRYHLLEMNYLQILGLLSQSAVIQNEYHTRNQQYHFFSKLRAFSMKFARKILYK